MAERTISALVVDDNANLADATAMALEQHDDQFEVRTVTAGSEALSAIASGPVDCVVSDYSMPGMDGLELLDRVRADYPELPFILYTGRGSEDIATRAIRKDATDYIRKGASTDAVGLLANRIENAVEHRRARRRASDHERINTVIREVNHALVRASTREALEREVCAILSDSEPYLFAWIGQYDEAAGEVVPRASAGVEEGYLEEVTITVDAEPTGQGPTGRAVRTGEVQVMQDILENDAYEPWREAARERGYQASAAVPLAHEDSVYGVLNVYAARPDAFDDTERAVLGELADDLSHSIDAAQTRARLQATTERLQTIIEASPTAIIATDEAGRVTLWNEAAENVFGWTREAVLGEPNPIIPEDRREEYADLFDRGTLEGESFRDVETVRRTAAGDLVDVSLSTAPIEGPDGDAVGAMAIIQDITERKAFEANLKALNEATRRLSGAEDPVAVAEIIVDIAVDVLDLSLVGVYLIDEQAGQLEPVASSAETEAYLEAMPGLDPGKNPGWEAFAANEPAVTADVEAEPTVFGPESPVESEFVVPIEGYGVLVGGDRARNEFDDRTVDLAEILAGAATETLQRTERESDVERQEEKIKRQATRLDQLQHTTRQIRAILQTVLEADTREGIETAVPEQLLETDLFSFVHVARRDPGADALDPVATAGDDEGYLDAISLGLCEEAGPPVVQAANTAAPTVVENTAEAVQAEPWRREALVRNHRSAIAVPLTFEDVCYGAIGIYSDQPMAFDELTRDLLVELGRTVGHAISSLERRNTMLSERVTEVEFAIEDEDCRYLRLARETDCTFVVDAAIRGQAEATTAFLAVTDGSWDHEAAERVPGVIETTAIGDAAEAGTIRVDLARPRLSEVLDTAGVRLVDLRVDGDAASVTVALQTDASVREVADQLGAEFSAADLKTRRDVHRADLNAQVRNAYAEELTDRQREVLETAYHSGFFEWPRDVSGTELAESLEIAPATLHNHLRSAERKLFDVVC